MPNPLATPADLADMWRPLADSETARAERLIVKASAMLRQNAPKAPSIDQRIALFATDPNSLQALDPDLVATVVATIVKRFISNVDGAVSQTESVSGYSKSTSWALRGDKDIRGEMQITEADLDKLRPYQPLAQIGSIRIRPAMAPPPFGAYGAGGIISSELLEMGREPVVIEVPVPIYDPTTAAFS